MHKTQHPPSVLYDKVNRRRKRQIEMEIDRVLLERHAVNMTGWRAGYASYAAGRSFDDELASAWEAYRQLMGWDFTDPRAPYEVYERFAEQFGHGWSMIANADQVLRETAEVPHA